MATSSRKRFAVGSTEEYEETTCFGNVVKARHRATGKFVAIKRLGEPSQRHSAQAVMREAEFLESCVGNPFVVGYHGIVSAPGSTELRIIMECVGPSLRDLLNKRGDNKDAPPLPESKLRSVMWQLLTGVKKMHEVHVMHRDIKPENILVSADRSMVKICDFGIALDMSKAPPYSQAGTMWYTAPEVLLGKKDYDALVDTWSLGCVMAELLDGDVLFEGVCNEDQLCCMTDVLGVPDDREWPWFASTPFATELLPDLPYVQRQNLLRKRFPEKMLSEEGYEVLSGLLEWNPDNRMTASAALKHPWFAALNGAPAPARKEELASAMPKILDPLNPHKRRKAAMRLMS
jgi:cell division cycle 2-like